MKTLARLLIFLVALAAFSVSNAWSAPLNPKLVLLISIDQFRADYLSRFEKRFLKNTPSKVAGFNYLLQSGSSFPQAEYTILQCMTGPGHAIMLSGSLPYRNGIPINAWFNSAIKEREYCVQDKETDAVTDRPLQRPMGASPRNFMGSTVGDELKNAGYDSRVVGIALKDRSSILMTGRRADAVFWHDSATHQWISSTYYFKDKKLPAWVSSINEVLEKNIGKKMEWKVEASPTHTGLSLNKTFEHTDSMGSYPSYAMPRGIEITTDLAIAAIQNMKLGKQKHPDLLAISYSSHDYLGHALGPNSLEMEEMTVYEDRELARLFQFLQRQLPNGLNDALIVLTADHGIAQAPDYLKQIGIGGTGPRLNDESIKKLVTEALSKEFVASEKNWVADSLELNLYLDRAVLEKRGVSFEAALAVAKKALLTDTKIESVLTRLDWENKSQVPGVLGLQWGLTFYPSRSGDIVVIPRAHSVVGADGHGVDHLTGFAFDRTVPILFAGKGIRKQVHPIQAKVQDIAPTLSFALGIIPPSLSEGRILNEIFEPIRK